MRRTAYLGFADRGNSHLFSENLKENNPNICWRRKTTKKHFLLRSTDELSRVYMRMMTVRRRLRRDDATVVALPVVSVKM